MVWLWRISWCRKWASSSDCATELQTKKSTRVATEGQGLAYNRSYRPVSDLLVCVKEKADAGTGKGTVRRWHRKIALGGPMAGHKYTHTYLLQ